MATVDQNGQSCLEKAGIAERNEEIVRSIYNSEDEYSATHPNAISDGDVKGKGTKSGGHGAWLPSCNGVASNAINYSNFDTVNGGGKYDIEGRNDIGGRNKAMASQLYNPESQYGAKLINSEENIAQGQFFMK